MGVELLVKVCLVFGLGGYGSWRLGMSLGVVAGVSGWQAFWMPGVSRDQGDGED